MSKNTGLLRMTGKIGEYVGYYRDGKQYFRSMPEQVRRSKATQLSAKDFGTASKASKLIRHGLRAELNIHHDNGMHNRLNTDMLNILYAGSQQRGSRSFQRNKLSMLTGMQFNEKTELSRLLPFTPKVVQDGNSLRIAIPALGADDIRHARNTTHIEIKAIAIGVNFNENARQDAVSDKVLIDFRCPATATELILPFKAGEEETIVVLQVRAFSELDGKLYALGNRKFFAADIIDIIPSLSAMSNITYNSQPELKPLPQPLSDVHYIQME